MERKEACRVIKEKLAQGQTKQAIYQELLPQVTFKSDLIAWLTLFPTQEVREKYRALNMILFSCLVFISIVKVLSVFVLFGEFTIASVLVALVVPLFSIYFAIAVWNYRGFTYSTIGGLGTCGILMDLLHYDQFADYSFLAFLFTAILNLPGIVAIILAFYLGAKMFPYYSFWGGIKEDRLDFVK